MSGLLAPNPNDYLVAVAAMLPLACLAVAVLISWSPPSGQKDFKMKLLIAMCHDCQRRNRLEGSEETAECPVLCEHCSDVTLTAWEAHRARGLSDDEMASMIHGMTAN